MACMSIIETNVKGRHVVSKSIGGQVPSISSEKTSLFPPFLFVCFW